MLAQCRRVAEILRAGADPDDATAYRQWVRRVALRICEASCPGEVPDPAGNRAGDGDRELLDRLMAALS